MASYRKRGATWFVEVRLKGVDRRGTFRTKAEATEWAQEIERSVRQGKTGIAHDRTLGDVLERFAGRRDRRTQTRLLWMQNQIGSVRLTELTPDFLAQWRDRRLDEVTKGSVRRDFNLLSSALSTAAKEWGWLPENPCRKLRKPADNPPRTRITNDEEMARLFYVAGYVPGTRPQTKVARVAAAFAFSVETALSAGEICQVNPGQVTGRVLSLPAFKTRPRREVPLSERAMQILAEVGGSFDLQVGSMDALWRDKIKRRALVEGLTFHDGRATAITRLSKIFDVLELARIVGHRDLNRLMVYYRPSGAELADKFESGVSGG